MLSRARTARLVWAILLVSCALRITLALLGGQRHFGDEHRYYRGAEFYLALQQGNGGWVRNLLYEPDHAGFSAIALALAPAHHALALLVREKDWSTYDAFKYTPQIGAALLGLFSTLNLWLVYRLARRAGADREESLWALLLAAASTTLFFYSRHLVPYDAALAFLLGGLWLGLRAQRGGRWLASGIITGLAYSIYNGYWLYVPVAGLAVGLTQPAVRPKLRAWLWWGGGVLIALALNFAPGWLSWGSEYWRTLAEFSRSVKHGVYAEGWSLPWAFLWHAEGWLGISLLAILPWAFTRENGRRAAWWLGWVAVAYGLLVLMSVEWHLFVVYARGVRPLVPFFCLVGGIALAHLTAGRRARQAIAALVIVGIAGWHFALLFAQQYPLAWEAKIRAEYGVAKNASAFTGTLDKADKPAVTRPDLAIVNTYLLFPVHDYAGDPAGEVLLATPHPLALKFYQYDGHVPHDREVLRAHPPVMKLIRLAEPAAVPDNPPPGFLTP